MLLVAPAISIKSDAQEVVLICHWIESALVVAVSAEKVPSGQLCVCSPATDTVGVAVNSTLKVIL